MIANARGALKSAAWCLKYICAIPIQQSIDDSEDGAAAAASDASDPDRPPRAVATALLVALSWDMRATGRPWTFLARLAAGLTRTARGI